MRATAPTTSRITSALDAKAIRLGTITVAVFAGIVLWAFIRHGYGWLLQSDAQHFYRVATDPFGDGSAFAGAPRGAGTAYRYGRILYPLTAWLLALGHPAWVRYSLPIVYLAGVWLLAALACDLCARAGKPAGAGLISLLVPSVVVMAGRLVPEPLVIALVLLTYRLIDHRRPAAARVVAAFLLLARETAALALAPLILHDLRRRRYASAMLWCAAVLPLAVWWTWVRIRIGMWPCFDPVNTINGPLDLPFRGFLAMAWHPDISHALLVGSLIGWATLASAAWLCWTRRRYPLTDGALSLALLIIVFGRGQADLPGEALRLMMPAQVLIALGYLAWSPTERRISASAPAD